MTPENQSPFSLEDMLKLIENDLEGSRQIQKEIQDLDLDLPEPVFDDRNLSVRYTPSTSKKVEREDPFDEYEYYLDDYLSFNGDSIEELSAILPSKDDYHYDDILLRLHAESLKAIKEITEYSYEDASICEDAEELIARENHKISLLQQLLFMEEVVDEDKPEFNKIILAPNISGNIRAIDDIDAVPLDYYPEVYHLLGSIIDGTFKKAKHFQRGTNSYIMGGLSEVKGTKIRILYKRVAKDTYAVFAIFMKKVNNSLAYQSMLRKRIADYQEVEDQLRESLSNSEFLEMNEDYLLELWNKLGHTEAPKTYRKEMDS